MPAIEELEQRVARLETLFEDVLKERINLITTRLDQIYEKAEKDKTELLEKIANTRADLYEKTERDKSEILAKTERDKSELSEKIANLYAKTERDKAEILAKTDKDKRELILWMVGLLIAFLTLNVTAMWAILSFALK